MDDSWKKWNCERSVEGLSHMQLISAEVLTTAFKQRSAELRTTVLQPLWSVKLMTTVVQRNQLSWWILCCTVARSAELITTVLQLRSAEVMTNIFQKGHLKWWLLCSSWHQLRWWQLCCKLDEAELISSGNYTLLDWWLLCSIWIRWTGN
jgi:hypothetical protein